MIFFPCRPQFVFRLDDNKKKMKKWSTQVLICRKLTRTNAYSTIFKCIFHTTVGMKWPTFHLRFHFFIYTFFSLSFFFFFFFSVNSSGIKCKKIAHSASIEHGAVGLYERGDVSTKSTTNTMSCTKTNCLVFSWVERQQKQFWTF